MKTSLPNLQTIVLAALLPTFACMADGVRFSENFESGLGQWVGKGGGTHSGVTVADPLASGRGQVLKFKRLVAGGDIFTAKPILISGPLAISFDYLGMPGLGGTPGNLGGFLGVAYNLNPLVINDDHIWYSGTENDFPGVCVPLIDDGSWHSYTIILDGTAIGSFRLILEDFFDAGGVAGDAFFDNIAVYSISERRTDLFRVEPPIVNFAPSISSQPEPAAKRTAIVHTSSSVTGEAALSVAPLLSSIRAYAGFELQGAVGASYRVEYTLSLPPTNWFTLTNIILPHSPFLIVDTSAPVHAQRFYRAITND
jgi:hypothetical protein